MEQSNAENPLTGGINFFLAIPASNGRHPLFDLPVCNYQFASLQVTA
jgi:hypothetical protein